MKKNVYYKFSDIDPSKNTISLLNKEKYYKKFKPLSIPGLKAICRTSLIFLFLIIILSLFTDLSLSVQIDINNFKPLSFESNYIYGFISYVSYNVIPLYLINIIPKYEIVNNNKTNKYIVLFYIISFFSINN